MSSLQGQSDERLSKMSLTRGKERKSSNRNNAMNFIEINNTKKSEKEETEHTRMTKHTEGRPSSAPLELHEYLMMFMWTLCLMKTKTNMQWTEHHSEHSPRVCNVLRRPSHADNAQNHQHRTCRRPVFLRIILRLSNKVVKERSITGTTAAAMRTKEKRTQLSAPRTHIIVTSHTVDIPMMRTAEKGVTTVRYRERPLLQHPLTQCSNVKHTLTVHVRTHIHGHELLEEGEGREEEEEEEELAKKRAKNNSNGAVEPIAEGAFLRQHVKQSTENLTIEEMKKRWREKLEALRAERHADQHKQKREKVTNKRKKLKEKRKAKSLVKGGVDAQGRPLASAKPGDQQKAPPVVFSKFEFANDNKKKKKSKPTPQQQLLKVEKEKEKLNKLKEANPEKANEVEESQAWKKALQRAEGGKVFDSEKLVKKKIKAVERKKTKSKKEWDERTSQVEKQKKERQEKRAKNLKARADAKKEKKMNKGKKKKSKPGFK
eukprot:m.180167 g.180167  ORF g.180167 m.180167 type:complete len:488 (-) comp13573_c2_seq9:81-1544(-)